MKVPEKDGWYWIKYRGKKGMVKCPCQVTHIKDEFHIRTARNDVFHSHSNMKSVKFGPRIAVPEFN